MLLVAATALLPCRQARAFVPASTLRYRSTTAHTICYTASLRVQDDISTTLDPLAVREYTEKAIHYRGEPRGLAALQKLGQYSSMRTPFDFENNSMNENGSTVVAPIKGLIPPSVTEEFLRQVHEMEQNGWLSTNPDSVDGLPSLHLNLVSGGKPVVKEVDGSQLNEFQRRLQKLLSTVEPYIYDKLLPTVQELINDPSIRVSDVFLRRYGDDIMEGTSRKGISAHYDVFSKVTSVFAMDDTAAEGTDGLYTTVMSNDGITSNHASLRRFFPLEKGDGVVHTWNVLHGVDVSPDSDRTSLIVWFTTEKVLESDIEMTSPWLTGHPTIETNDVTQFVLASALTTSTDDDDLTMDAVMPHPHDLYLKSAESGNTFALTRLGSLAKEQELSLERAMRGVAILNNLRPSEELPFEEQIIGDECSISYDALAKRFWFEGAVRGNPLAQAHLADEVMELAANTRNDDMRVLAAVLFGLAAQQGHDIASESLSRVVEFEVASSLIQSQEEFEASPVVKTANAALQSSKLHSS